VQLLRHSRIWPCRRRQLRDLLERETRLTDGGEEVKPVLTNDVLLTRIRGLVTFSVDKAKKLSPKLGANARICAVKDYLAQLRDA
jgi:hypothetical protein